MTRIAIAVVGASGRMGKAVVRLATQAGDRVVCAIGSKSAGRDAGELAGIGPLALPLATDPASVEGSGASVLIDFSSPACVPALARAAARANCAIVSGTTGLDAEGQRALNEASAKVAVLWEPNMSVGVAVLADLVREAVLRLGAGYDIEVVEVHHRRKVDAPSGTALRLVEVAENARGDLTRRTHGRDGRPGPRAPDEVGVHAIRGGDVIGDHTVHLLGSGERLELTHRATDRDVFAHGALRAARWLVGKPAGRYTLRDVLGR